MKEGGTRPLAPPGRLNPLSLEAMRARIANRPVPVLRQGAGKRRAHGQTAENNDCNCGQFPKLPRARRQYEDRSHVVSPSFFENKPIARSHCSARVCELHSMCVNSLDLPSRYWADFQVLRAGQRQWSTPWACRVQRGIAAPFAMV